MGVFTGTAGNDFLSGGDEDDFVIGLGGDDDLRGGAGGDRIEGGGGVDRARYDDAVTGVSISLIAGRELSGGSIGDILVSVENLLGSRFRDNLQGDDGANVIDGGGGLDNLVGHGGNDTLRGGGTLFGGQGDDVLIGDASADTLDGGIGDDLLEGRGGADLLIGGAGLDTASYRTSAAAVRVDLGTGIAFDADARGDRFSGVENLTGSAFADRLTGDAGANRLSGLAGADTLSGGGGRDTIDGGEGDDFQFGNDGDDLLLASAGADTLSGGGGIDMASYIASTAGITVTLGGGGAGGLAAGDILTLVENLAGSGFADTLRGDGAANSLFAGAGADRLEGGGGADLLDGGTGADTMAGGAGNDVYRVDLAGDRIDEAAAGSGGIDTVQSRISFDLATAAISGAVENLTLTGPGALTARGNALANTILGGSGDNLLSGRSGSDVLTGGLGADQFLFDAPVSGANVDAVTDFSVLRDTLLLENAFFLGLTEGALAAGAFRIGARALDADDRILYDAQTGAVLFDRDGTGRQGATQFADLDPGLALGADDFLIV